MWLHFYVYADQPAGSPRGSPPPTDDALPPQFRDAVLKDVPQHWECVDQIDNKTGLRAQRWDPKDRSKDHVSICEPTIIFRGSMPVYKNIALYLKIEVGNYGKFSTLMIPEAKESGVDPKKVNQNDVYFGGTGRMAAEDARDGLIKDKWEAFTLFDEEHVLDVPSMPRDWFNFTVHPRVKLTAEILAGQDGDWVNNFRQGWGAQSDLYNRAMDWARSQMKQIIAEYDPPRVFFVGHSLGGGLAGAVAQRMAFEFQSEKRLHIRGLTFNAAGVHPKTVSYWPKNKQEDVGLRMAPVIDHTVLDEILTTLQSRYNDLPLIGHILRIAKRTFPEAVTAIGYERGLSPGPSPRTPEFGPVGAEQPLLFPLSVDGKPHQTAIPKRTDWPGIDKLQAVLAGSATVLELAQNLLNDIIRTESATALKSPDVSSELGYYPYMVKAYFKPVLEELEDVKRIMLLSVHYHFMQTVAQTYVGKV